MSRERLAIVPVRGGRVPFGATEAVAAAGGRVWVVGDGTADAVAELEGIATAELWATESATFRPGALAEAMAARLAERHLIVVPGSPDGRDLAPRIAASLDRPLVPYAIELDDDRAVIVGPRGLVEIQVHIDGPAVVTMQPGATGVLPTNAPLPRLGAVELEYGEAADAPVVAALPPDPVTIDLADAPRIVGAGAGLADAERVALLGRVGEVLGAALGATRVVTDAGWADTARQIGTTGVAVDPELYVAVAISGAVQHVLGLGDPSH
ncbi:MAG: mycofactocin-associated electron transfer flavoprotein alpha subunit, partial [Acidimicrobiia bacterium]|nr:mycofactocin-associated electron transfer flavoprotein alpha subunit [Acidimicrobiia bacterium]